MASQTPERRHEVRLPVPWRLRGANLHLGLGGLLDLSFRGVRIEADEPLQTGRVCEVDLPPALGWGRLTGRVVWTRPHEPNETLEGNTRFSHQSGLAFVEMTPAQRVALVVALSILETGE